VVLPPNIGDLIASSRAQQQQTPNGVGTSRPKAANTINDGRLLLSNYSVAAVAEAVRRHNNPNNNAGGGDVISWSQRQEGVSSSSPPTVEGRRLPSAGVQTLGHSVSRGTFIWQSNSKRQISNVKIEISKIIFIKLKILIGF
jgi:hypothetical protein